MYKVIKFFTDLQDNGHPYNVGEIFPQGMTVSSARFAELSGSKNRQGCPLIAKVEDEEKKVLAPKIEESKSEPEIETKEPASPKKTKKAAKKNEE